MKYTITQFIEFANQQSGPYNYSDNRDCAIAQFLKHHGHKKPWVGGSFVIFDTTDMTIQQIIDLSREFLDNGQKSTANCISFDDLFKDNQWTEVHDLRNIIGSKTWEELQQELQKL